jgi:hypothetical protein
LTKKKDEKKKVVELPSRVVEEPKELSQEEIEYVQQRDEEEIERHLSKFKTFNSVASSAGVQEEDEEEIITLDLEKGTAIEKRESVIAGEDLLNQIEKAVGLVKPKLQLQFADLITERFVSKAIASLIAKTNKAIEAIENSVEKEMKFFNGAEGFSYEASNPIYKRKDELRRAYYLGHVDYEKIPQWAEAYIQEYITNAINNMLDLTEQA